MKKVRELPNRNENAVYLFNGLCMDPVTVVFRNEPVFEQLIGISWYGFRANNRARPGIFIHVIALHCKGPLLAGKLGDGFVLCDERRVKWRVRGAVVLHDPLYRYL